jgi:hypothetical protein
MPPTAAEMSADVEALMLEESEKMKDLAFDRASDRYQKDRHRATGSFPPIMEANQAARTFVDGSWRDLRYYDAGRRAVGEQAPPPRVGHLLPAPDPREVPDRQPRPARGLPQRHPLDRGQHVPPEHAVGEQPEDEPVDDRADRLHPVGRQ